MHHIRRLQPEQSDDGIGNTFVSICQTKAWDEPLTLFHIDKGAKYNWRRVDSSFKGKI